MWQRLQTVWLLLGYCIIGMPVLRTYKGIYAVGDIEGVLEVGDNTLWMILNSCCHGLDGIEYHSILKSEN